jgi:hypothetical protein
MWLPQSFGSKILQEGLDDFKTLEELRKGEFEE